MIIDLKKKVLLVFLAHEKNPKNQLHCQFNNCPKTEKKWLFAHENSRQKIMWDQFLILPFDTKSHDKKITHKTTVKLSNKVSHLYIFLQLKKKKINQVGKYLSSPPHHRFSDLFLKMDLKSIFFAQPGDFFPTDLFHPKSLLKN